MSFKTLRKRIALVAVAALAVTGLSTVPANAAAQTGEAMTAVNATLATANTYVAGTTQTIYVGGTIAAVGDMANTEDQRIRVTATSFPANGFVGATGLTNTATLTFTGAAVSDTGTNNSVRVLATANATAAGTVTATGTDGLAAFSVTPTVAGTYSFLVWNDIDDANDFDSGEAFVNVSMTITAAPGYSAALSTAFIAEDLTDADNTGLATAATDAADKPLAIRTIGQKAAQIIVTTRSTSNAIYTGQTITATMSGSGFVTAGSAADANADGVPTATEADTADGTASTTRTASVASAANTTGIVAIGVWGDGTAGTGTVTITVTDKVSGATTTLATKTVTWYSGTAATLEATVLQSIATPGAANGCANATTCTQATLALTPAVVVVAKDSGGRVIPGLTITGTSSDTSIIAATNVVAVTASTDKNGRGYYNVSVTGGSSANVGKKAKVTFSTTLADGVTVIKAADVEFSLAGTPASVTMSVDKASYTPGAPVKITVTAKDAAGNLAADGTYANLFAGASTLGGSFTGSTPAASVEIKNGVATYDAFAPGTSGTYSISNKLGTSLPAAVQGATVTTSVAVGASAEIASVDAKIAALVAAIAKLQKAINKINKRLAR